MTLKEKILALKSINMDAYILLREASVYRNPVTEDVWLSHLEYWDMDKERQQNALACLSENNLIQEEKTEKTTKLSLSTEIREIVNNLAKKNWNPYANGPQPGLVTIPNELTPSSESIKAKAYNWIWNKIKYEEDRGHEKIISIYYISEPRFLERQTAEIDIIATLKFYDRSERKILQAIPFNKTVKISWKVNPEYFDNIQFQIKDEFDLKKN